MREIKFQAFVKPIPRFANRQVGFMIDVSEIDFNERYVADDDGTVYYFDEIELIQYTGLKDSGGLEIYEGDILEMAGQSLLRFEIVYEDDRMAFVRKWIDKRVPTTRGNGETEHLSANTDFLEVVGNRYENPELLKEEPTC